MPTSTTHYNFYLPLVNNATDADLWGGYLNSNFTSLDTILYSLLPTGMVNTYAGPTEPSGWLFCYGQAISRSTYSALFGVIGTTYGAGDTTTTFNLPDMRGRAAAGRDDMGGSAASRITTGVSGIDGVTLGAAGGDQRMQQHLHRAGNAPTLSSTSLGVNFSFPSFDTGSSSYLTENTGAGNSQNVQPSLILNYIIKT